MQLTGPPIALMTCPRRERDEIFASSVSLPGSWRSQRLTTRKVLGVCAGLTLMMNSRGAVCDRAAQLIDFTSCGWSCA